MNKLYFDKLVIGGSLTAVLYAYKNREQIGAMSSTMWAQASMLSDSDIETLSEFIQKELK